MCRHEITARSGLEWDHHIPLAIGGDDDESNLQPLCKGCHRLKTGKDLGTIAKGKRVRQRHLGIRPPSRFPGSRDSHLRKKIDGTVVDRRTGEIVRGRS
jgi:5-methylcytosine-specific restriction endonuclease McrA